MGMKPPNLAGEGFAWWKADHVYCIHLFVGTSFFCMPSFPRRILRAQYSSIFRGARVIRPFLDRHGSATRRVFGGAAEENVRHELYFIPPSFYAVRPSSSPVLQCQNDAGVLLIPKPLSSPRSEKVIVPFYQTFDGFSVMRQTIQLLPLSPYSAGRALMTPSLSLSLLKEIGEMENINILFRGGGVPITRVRMGEFPPPGGGGGWSWKCGSGARRHAS